jgi:hypothetical protein
MNYNTHHPTLLQFEIAGDSDEEDTLSAGDHTLVQVPSEALSTDSVGSEQNATFDRSPRCATAGFCKARQEGDRRKKVVICDKLILNASC